MHFRFARALPASIAFASTVAGAAETASFKFPTQTLTVPAGFTVEQVAAPPMTNRPISIAFDELGRLYVTDSSGLSDRADVQFEQKPHRIVRLDDGDGTFEKSTVFAEKVMFPQGALFHDGSLYVGAPPHIWKLTDTNDDGVSDERVAWYDGKTLTGCANDLHGPYLGHDGWFYWTKGANAEQRHTLPNGKQMVSRASHIFRSRPDGAGLEPVLTGGMANPVGVAFTATGERILSGTFFQVGVPGKRDGLIHAIYGGVYGRDNATLEGHTRTGDLMPIMTHMGASAPCGATAYRSGGFGRDFDDNLFVCYFNFRKVSRHRLVADGATFATVDTDFLTSDSPDFRPTDVLEDADGSLLVVDTGGWYKICCPTSQLAKPDILGGLYRIRKTGAPKIADPRGLELPWASLTAADLAKLLADVRPCVVDRAMHELGKQGDAAVAAIRSSTLVSVSVAARRHGVWTLARIDSAEARATVRTALQDPDASVVQTALQAVSLHRDAAANDILARLVSGQDAQHARLAAEALGRIGDARAIPPLLSAIGQLGDTTFTATGTPESPAEQILEHAFIYALIEIGRREELLAHLRTSTPPRLARAALVALDQMTAGGLKPEHVLPWLNSSVARVKRTAGWIVSHRPDWGGELAEHYGNRLGSAPGSAAEQEELQRQIASLAKAPAIQNLLAASATDATAQPATRLLALRTMAAAALKEAPARWLTDLAALLATADAALLRQAVATIRALPLPKGGHPALATALARVGRNPAISAAIRLEALAVSPAALGSLEPALFAFVLSQLDDRQPMLVRSSAASVLARALLSRDQQLALADAMKTVGPLEAPKVLPAFERDANEALGLRLVAALQASPGRAGLRGNALKPVLAKYPESVRQQGEALLASLNGHAARENARVDKLLATVKGGDIRRGQAVFNSEKTACMLCHTMGHLGGKLGPDLTKIGQIRSERELLEAVIYPSATFVRGYEPFTATTTAGESHSGILRKETADEIVLATGPGSEQRVARSAVAELEPGTVSPMPPGMDVVLTPQELGDLVAFLKSTQ